MLKRYFGTDDTALFLRAFQYLKPYKRKLILVFICIVSGIGIGLIQPLIFGKILVNIFGKDYYEVLKNIMHLVILYLLQLTTGFIQSYLFSFLSNHIIQDMRFDMYKKIHDLPVKAFDEVRTGEFMSRIHGDVALVANILTNESLGIIIDILKIIVIGITIFTISIPLSLVTILVFPILSFFIFRLGKAIKENSRGLKGINDSCYSAVQQTIIGIREIKSLGAKRANQDSFGTISSALSKKSIYLSMLNTLSQMLAQGVGFLSEIGVMLLGGYLVFKGVLRMEYYVAFTSYSKQFSGSLMHISKINANIQQCLVSLERIFGLLDNLGYPEERFGGRCIDTIEGEIAFEKICFEYLEQQPVLRDISFTIPKNGKVALVGRSGSGKSTIFNLLLRFYEARQGEISIDGINIREFNEPSLRKHISIVRQAPFLFNTSIKENLLFANPEASEEDIILACKAACIHEYVMSLPKAYNTVVGENAVRLSGGQKQRIAIARALLRNSKIILFDEATSALDNESQENIKAAIDRISQNHTVVIIAHRLSTIIEADNILVIEQGTIAGQGSHGTLINKNPVYKCLYETELNIMHTKQGEAV